jgi:hypothetical protein
MGRARKKNRRSRPDRNNSNGPGGLDRDDDFPMHGVEHTLPPSSRRHAQKYNKNNSNNSSGNYDISSRGSKKHNPINAFHNPFQQPNTEWSRFLVQKTRFQQAKRRNRNQEHENESQRAYHNHRTSYNGEGSDQYQSRHFRNGTNIISTRDSIINSSSRDHNKKNNTLVPFSPPSADLALPTQTSTLTSWPGRGRLTRFCIECSAVRRANLTLRNWFSSFLLGASEVVDGWSEEVGVGSGTGDEMDWQPEPVVRVLILASNAAAGMGCTCSPTQQRPHQPYGGGCIGQAFGMNHSGSGNGMAGAGYSVNDTTGMGMGMGLNPSQWAAGQPFLKMISPPESPPSPIG